MTKAITDIRVIAGDQGEIGPPDTDWVKVPVDLNMGAGGKYIYLCYKRGDGAPITGVTVILGKNAAPPQGWTKDPMDLNWKVGGDYIYVCWTTNPGTPVLDIVVQAWSKGGDRPVPVDYRGRQYTRVNVDLNKGAGGKYIYLSYLRAAPDPALPNFAATSNALRDAIPLPGDTYRQEWEMTRAQIGLDAIAVRLFDMQRDLLERVDATLPVDFTVTEKTGAETTKAREVAKEFSASLAGEISNVLFFNKLSASISGKLAVKDTESFKATEETTTTNKIVMPAADHARTLLVGTLCDVVRIYSLNAKERQPSELVQQTNVHGRFVNEGPIEGVLARTIQSRRLWKSLNEKESEHVVSSGSTTLRGTWLFDLDTGTQGGSGADKDLWWEQVTATARFLTPQNNAALANLGVVDFDSIALDALKAAHYESTRIDGSTASNHLVPGTVVAVRTGARRYAKILIQSYGYNLGIRWATYE